MNLYPSILTDSLKTLQEQINLLKDHDQIKVVQIDIIDGQFAENLTVTPLDLLDIDFAELKIDLHLMVEEPMDFVYEAVSIKRELPVRAIIAQVERMSYFEDYLEEVKKHDWQVGLSLDLHTPVSEINSYLAKLDILQLMGIEAGFQGQKLQESIFEKIKLAKAKLRNNTELIIDGGVKTKHLQQLENLGATGVSVGSALWQAESVDKAIQEFLKI